MGQTLKTIALFFFILFSNRLLAQYEPVFNIPFPRQYQVLDSIIERISYEDTTNASEILSQLGIAAQQTHNEQNLLNYKRSLLIYRYVNSRDTHDTAILNTLIRDERALLETVDGNKYPEIAAMINVTIGNTAYNKTQQYSLAFEHFIKAYNLFKNVSIEQFPDRQYSQYAIAMAYYKFNDYKNAIRLGKEIASIYPEKNYISIFNMDMIGMCYLRMAHYDSAIANFKWVLDNVQYSGNPKAWEGIVSGNIGNAFFLQNQYDNALPYLEQAVNLTIEENVPDNTADFAAWASAIYLKQKDSAIAKKYLEIAQQAVWRSRSASNYYNVYKALADFYKVTGNTKMALHYTDSAIIFKDSLTKILDVNMKYQGEMAVEAEHKQQQERIFEEERTRQMITRNGLIILIVLVMIITLLYYNRIRLKNKHREQQLLTEKQLAETELNNAVMQLKDFTKSIIEKNELLEKASVKIEEMNTAYKELQEHQAELIPSNSADDHSLKLLQDSVLLTDDDWKNFSKLFDKVYPGFFIRVKEKLPGLSPAETRFVALSKLKLNNKEMAGMLGVSTDAIRQSRSRFRKKLSLSEDASIEEAIDVI
jgi:tetratricopeptide (TPR) repeat protein